MIPLAALLVSASAAVPVELGRVPWQHDFDEAMRQARSASLPMMVLFDEVPGCLTCQRFGSGPLSHPIVVDAASLCVPVVVYNNTPGRAAEILARYAEPSWNNPVVRFLDSSGKDLIPRVDGDWSTPTLLRRQVAALQAAGRPVPAWLRLAEAELNPAKPETAVFGMHCYWEGEAALGGLDGVIGTRIGMLQGSEVVEVDYDAARLDYPLLVGQARRAGMADRIFARDGRQASAAASQAPGAPVSMLSPQERARTDTQQQYHLALTPRYHFLPLTALQATRVNAALATHGNPDEFLSPGQIRLGEELAALPPGRLAKILSGLTPDRSVEGLPGYAHRLRSELSRQAPAAP